MIHVLINECNKIYNLNKKHTFIWNKLSKNTDINSFDSSIQNVNDKINFESLIKKLNYKDQLIITLYYNSNYSCEQISKILKINRNTVKSKLLRARQKLKNIYEEGKNND